MRDREFLFSSAKAMRHDPTLAERALWRLLRGRRSPASAGGPARTPHRRLRLFDPKLIVECDGGHHGGERDERRDRWFELQGFRVVRMWNSEVLDDGDDAALVILEQRLQAPRDPSPSPR